MTVDASNIVNQQDTDNEFIPLCVPEIKGNEWKYIKDCLDTNWVSSVGAYVDSFEQSIARYLGRRYAVACVNGTSALHIALLVSGVGINDEVIVPALTFIAPVNAIRYTGAYPVFIDICDDIWQMDVNKLKDFLSRQCVYTNGCLVNKVTKRKIKAIIPVHILGHPVDMSPIMEMAREYNLIVIEDAAESLGAEYKGKKVGAIADIACLSFNGNKIITSAGGGMIVTDDSKMAEEARYLTTQAKDDALEAIHNHIGYNYRLTNIQAAMGLAQMEMLEEYIKAKRQMADYYRDGLKAVAGITLPKEAEWARSVFWLYTILLDEDKTQISSREMLNILKEHNIETRPLWHPVYKLLPFRGCYSYKIKTVDRLYQQGLSLPSSVGITRKQQDRVINIIKRNITINS